MLNAMLSDDMPWSIDGSVQWSIDSSVQWSMLSDDMPWSIDGSMVQWFNGSMVHTPSVCWQLHSKANSSCCPARPCYPIPRGKIILGVIYGLLLWADMNAATPLGGVGALCNFPCTDHATERPHAPSIDHAMLVPRPYYHASIDHAMLVPTA